MDEIISNELKCRKVFLIANDISPQSLQIFMKCRTRVVIEKKNLFFLRRLFVKFTVTLSKSFWFWKTLQFIVLSKAVKFTVVRKFTTFAKETGERFL